MLIGFIAGGLSYMVMVPHAYGEDPVLGAQNLLTDVITRTGTSDGDKPDWGKHVVATLRSKPTLSRPGDYRNRLHGHPTEEELAQERPDLTSLRFFMGTLLADTDPLSEDRDVPNSGGDWLHTTELAEIESAALHRSRGAPTFGRNQSDHLTVHLLAELGNDLTRRLFAKEAKEKSSTLQHMLDAPALVLQYPAYDLNSDKSMFVVDFDNDTVAAYESEWVQQGSNGRAFRCASMSSREEMLRLAAALKHGARAEINFQHRWATSEDWWRQEVQTWQRLSGGIERSIRNSRCAANLNRPSGFPLLCNRERYPTEDDLSLLPEHHQPYERLPVDEAEDMDDDTGWELDVDRLERASDAALQQAAVTGRNPMELLYTMCPNPDSTLLSSKTYQRIIALKKKRKYTNEQIAWIVSSRMMTPVTKSLVQTYTRRMPGVRRARKNAAQ